MPTLQGALARLRPATEADIPTLAKIRQTPEVYVWWRGGSDLVAAIEEDLNEHGVNAYVIEVEDRVVGWIQTHTETDPDYRHASIDIYVDPAVHGRGIGTDAVRTLARHLFVEEGHHRVIIDPAVDNAGRHPLVQQGRLQARRRDAPVRARRRRLLARQPPHGPPARGALVAVVPLG